jgi:raffinose/stachyose/melibiose transport system substrate-binding protein
MRFPALARRRWGAFALAATVVFAAAASGCSSNSNGSNSPKASDTGPVTLSWWHNGDQDPAKGVWQSVADAYTKAHPNVTFKISPTQNEALKTKVPVALQSSDPPSIFQQWGGGAEATQAQSGKLMDMTDTVKPWISSLGNSAALWQANGKQYGIPYDLHVVGFWYRTDLFTQAGISAPPKTLDDFNADIAKLKTAGITPIAVGSKDKWPDAFWWSYFSLRECSQDTIKSMVKDLKMTDPCWVKAGQDLATFLGSKPFQNAFLGTPAQQGAGSSAGLVANGKAAMELQGDWDLPTMIPLATDKNYASKLGWFPFPDITGAPGTPGAALGGGDGFSCSSKAGPSCPDFLKYLSSTEVQTKLVQTSTATLPANPAAISAITDPTLKVVQTYLSGAPFIQLYYDQALPTAVGNALNDAIANFFAGQGSPQGIVDAFAKAVSNQ